MLHTGKKGVVLFSIFGSNEKLGHIQAGVTEEVFWPENSGALVKLEGCSYLFKGFLNKNILHQLEVSKDTSWLLLSIFKNKVIFLYHLLLFVFFRKKAIKEFVRLCNGYFDVAYRYLEMMQMIPTPNEWCTSVKEYYRVSEIILSDVKNGRLKRVLEKLRDIALMIPEMDTAYRFVAQDILPEIDKSKNLIKELKRVFKLMIVREDTKSQKEKWVKVEKLLKWALSVPFVRKAVKRFITELDMEKVKLDESDWYFVLGHHCYNYQDVSYEDRMAERMKIDKEKGHRIPILQLKKMPDGKIGIVCVGYGGQNPTTKN